ncbi:MAG: DUF1828 domain-containing protein [Lacunisphaera sp.]|jgi:hypothetical protein|nr:DUF1828 domain-containing protein [Lacunisphaera sp.]
MLAIEGKRLIADYLAWLKEGFHTEDSPDHVVISTPFLDPHNDEMQIFVEKQGDNLRLSDDGYTIADLSDMGLDVNTDKREAHVRQILNGFGVHLDKSGELAVTATPRDFPQKKHNLMQAMLAMHDLAVMGQSHVAQFFEEDVAAFLRERGVSFFRNLKLSGRSGFDHHFDFGFSATSRRPESVMQAVNSLSRDLATSVAFAVNDVRLQRGTDAIQAYTIVNDRDVKPSLDYIDALKAYGITVHTWNEREALVPVFGRN